MKTRSSGITLLSGLLMATPTFAQVAGQTPNEISVSETQKNLFISQTTFIADAGNGFTRKVLLAVRLSKNTGSGRNRCDLKDQPDSITIEVLDDKTKQVLAVASRLFGTLKQGEVDLFRESNTYDCIRASKELSLIGNTLTISDGYNSPSSLSISNFGTITLPAQVTFKR